MNRLPPAPCASCRPDLGQSYPTHLALYLMRATAVQLVPRRAWRSDVLGMIGRLLVGGVSVLAASGVLRWLLAGGLPR